MKVEIWSDVMCPFCYIGKRRFENALSKLPFRDSIEVVWKSFQLNPDLKDLPGTDVYTYVAELKGQTREWSVSAHRQLVNTAREIGLDYRFDIAQIANSFDAHRTVQLAKTKGLGGEMEERLFRAYFTEGVRISDRKELVRLALDVGLSAEETNAMLSGDSFSKEVQEDEAEATRLGVSGVPFFAIDRRFAISGAQPEAVFIETLTNAYRTHTSTR